MQFIVALMPLPRPILVFKKSFTVRTKPDGNLLWKHFVFRIVSRASVLSLEQ